MASKFYKNFSPLAKIGMGDVVCRAVLILSIDDSDFNWVIDGLDLYAICMCWSDSILAIRAKMNGRIYHFALAWQGAALQATAFWVHEN